MNTMRTVGQVAGFSLMVAPMALIGQSAFATPTCPTTTPAATLVAPGICEVAFTEAGDYTFTAPAGITKLQAVVVGGGASAWLFNGLYGGGGGDVQFFDDVDFSAPVEITVGAGGIYDGGIGEDSALNGELVSGGQSAGSSGNGNELYGMNGYGAAGAGAGGDAPSGDTPGVGVKASEIANGSNLFPAIDGELAFGAGGDSIVELNTSIDETPAIPGNGGNGVSLYDDGGWIYGGEDGVDGAVFLRWAPPTPLASTGVDGAGILAAGASLVAGGVVLAATRRRTQRA